MRYGGHQTFTLRDGWLFKGMELLMDENNRYKLVDPLAMDYLGVGRNMAKSINHWLLATGLAKKKTEENVRGRIVEKKDLLPTKLAELIYKYDPYFMDAGTWWILHINMIKTPLHGATWNWFFNNFGQERFQKQVCLNSLIRYENMHSGRNPSHSTLDRDLGCFLASYSQEIPSRSTDPEDEIISPLSDLGLMTYYRSSGYYNVVRKTRDIPYHIFLYSIALSEPDDLKSENAKTGQVPFYDLLQWTSGPSRVFVLGNEELFELLLEYDNHCEDFSLLGMAGERMVQYQRNQEDPTKFIENYFSDRMVKS